MPAAQTAIGVFDSGVGGLSVLREVRVALPAEHLLYVADSGAAPYGERPAEFILERAQVIVEFLLGRNSKAIVVACNTATAVAIQSLRARYAVPMIAIEPAVKPAAALSRSGVIGILATRQTLASENFSRLAERYGKGVRVLAQACPGLAEQVEKGELEGEPTQAMVAACLAPLLAQGADTIVLGCTHYPFLLPVIRAAAGPGVAVIDPAQAVARELRRRLESDGLLRAAGTPATERFWSSGAAHEVMPVMAKLWGSQITVNPLP